LAAQAAGKAQKALTGDIYTRRWVSVEGKGKKAKLVEHEAHLNPLIAVLGLGAAATAGVAALWLAQLKLTPVHHQTYKTVIDTPAYTETRPIAEVGHWADNVVVVGKMDPIWIEGTWIKGIYKPGRWITPDKVQTAPGQHWVVDVAAGVDKIPHAAITHQEPTGKSTLRFAIEQRQPFTISDLLPNPVNAFKEATGLDKPVFGDWSKGQIFARKWW